LVFITQSGVSLAPVAQFQRSKGGTAMQDFKKLIVWQKSHALTLRVYEATANFPKAEIFGLTSQMRRAATSIPSNIAEGSCRRGNREFARFLQVAIGSAGELEYDLLLSVDLAFLERVDGKRLEREVIEIKRMLTGLIRRISSETLGSQRSASEN
jgi:four helix bundle protein